MKQNPFLTSFTTSPFIAVRPEHMVPAVEQTIQACRDTVTQVLAKGKPYRCATLWQLLSEAENRLQRFFSAINHLNNVMNTPEIRTCCEACQQWMTDFRSWLGQHEPLSLAWQQLRDSEAYPQLSQAQQCVLDNTIRDFLLAGVALYIPQKQRFTQINARLSELQALFANNELDATMAWSKNILDEQQLAGLPASVIALLRNQALEQGLPGWLLTLTIPCYLPMMTWAGDRGRREEIYCALWGGDHFFMVSLVTAPLKTLLPDYRAIEERIDSMLRKTYGLPQTQSREVKKADLIMLGTERRGFGLDDGTPWPILEGIEPASIVIEPLLPHEASELFLDRYSDLVWTQSAGTGV